MISRKFTSEEISEIIEKLKLIFPDYEVEMSLDRPSVVKPEYVRFCKKIGESKLDGKVMVGIYDIQYVHIFECYQMISAVKKKTLWEKITLFWKNLEKYQNDR
jgi:hypothetical protein